MEEEHIITPRPVHPSHIPIVLSKDTLIPAGVVMALGVIIASWFFNSVTTRVEALSNQLQSTRESLIRLEVQNTQLINAVADLKSDVNDIKKSSTPTKK